MGFILTVIIAVLIGWLSQWSYSKFIAKDDCGCGGKS